MMRSLYLLIDLFTVIVPLAFSFHPRIRFYKEWKWFMPANILTAVLFITWDMIFTGNGIWGFDPGYILGIYIYNIPLEEVLFFICIPYACVFTYYCLDRFFKPSRLEQFETSFILLLSFSLLIAGIIFYSRSYTSATFISLSLVLFFLKFFFKVPWLSKLLGIYPLLLIPFFIVNGVLTGSWTQHPVVWYNDQENLGIRLFTIPIEDIFYGFELILLNIFFYKRLKSASRMHITL